MCHLGDREKFKSNLFNFETDSRELAKFDIISYDSPKNRSTHYVIPILRPTNKKIIQELIDNKICEELSKFFEMKDENGKRTKINREKFRQLFWERFTFEKDPNMLLENELIEIRKKCNIAPNNWVKKDEYGNSMFVKFYLDKKLAKVIIKFNCSCSKKYEIDLPINEFLELKWTFNGKKGLRVYRGLFKCTSCGLEINADVNGAINHAKWGKESSFDHFSKELLNKILPIPFSMPTAPA